jgi:magnesium transporter
VNVNGNPRRERIDLADLIRGEPPTLDAKLAELHEEDLADLIERAPVDVAVEVLRHLPHERSASVLECIAGERRADLVERLGSVQTALIAAEMKADERADMLGELEAPVAEAVLAQMEPGPADEARRLAVWPEHSAGAHMTTEALRVAPDITVAQAVDKARAHGEEAETVYYVYVVDGDGRLKGVISLRELLLAPADRAVSEVMRPEVLGVEPMAPVEQAARLIAHYNLIALPVLDKERRVLGLVTVDDVMDVIHETTTADFHRVGAVEPVATSYLQTRFATYFAKRAPWLAALFFAEILTGDALGHFEHVIQQVTALVFFIPLILSSGGNAGSQSASIIIRSLAVGELKPAQAMRVASREAATGLALGLMLGLVGVTRALLWGNGGEIALVVGVSLIGVVLVGSILGAMLPMLLEHMGLDPAVSSTPFIASLSDLFGIMLYFSVARAFFL